MAKDNEGQTLRDYGKRKKRYRRIRAFVICLLLFAIGLAGLAYWYRLNNMVYHNYEISHTTPNTGGIDTQYISFGSSVVKYNKDGAEAIDKEGKALWNATYEMTDPIADTCGDYVVIADRGNKSIHIFHKKGEIGSINTLHNIIKVRVANQGVVAALMEEEDTSYIKLFYTDGIEATSSEESSILTEIASNVNENGFPTDIALSKDGKKLVVNYLSINSGKLLNQIGFYNYGEVGQNQNDNMVGGFKYEGIVIPRIEFLNNDTVCIYKENGLVLYSMRETPNLITEINYDVKIKSILHSSKYTGVVLEGEEGKQKQLLLYDLKGNLALDQEVEFDYKKIFITGEEVVMYDNLSCYIMKTNGKEKFKYTFTSNISALYPVNHLDYYLLVNATEVSGITLVE